ncbi:hypothetical protein ACHRVZ_04315 [Flavobacterium sp. FlaQc-57]|uniref:hypothetical protein n=1 Tax=Flavobacterium sp. FlaQc-57 TaxID=3374186 RepID=UPI0037568DEB
MTIQEYLERIETLNKAENLDRDSDLGRIAVKIVLDCKQNYFDFFSLTEKDNEAIFSINLEIADKIAQSLGLIFLNQKETGNVCFANSDEVRPEFRQSFTTIDLLDYIFAMMHHNKDLQKIPIPLDTLHFWKLVQFGKDLRIKEAL